MVLDMFQKGRDVGHRHGHAAPPGVEAGTVSPFIEGGVYDDSCALDQGVDLFVGDIPQTVRVLGREVPLDPDGAGPSTDPFRSEPVKTRATEYPFFRRIAWAAMRGPAFLWPIVCVGHKMYSLGILCFFKISTTFSSWIEETWLMGAMGTTWTLLPTPG